MFKRIFNSDHETTQLDVVVHFAAAFVACYKAGTTYVDYKKQS